MEDRAAWEREMVRVFLSEHDAPCPGCGYNLRGTPGDKCPECGAIPELGLRGEAPRSRWDTLAAIAVVVSAIYFAVQGIHQGWMVSGGAYRGASLAPIRMWMAVNAACDLLAAAVCAAWCVAMWRARSRRPRPPWAIPTNAATGVLLGTFVLYLMVYTLRYLML